MPSPAGDRDGEGTASRGRRPVKRSGRITCISLEWGSSLALPCQDSINLWNLCMKSSLPAIGHDSMKTRIRWLIPIPAFLAMVVAGPGAPPVQAQGLSDKHDDMPKRRPESRNARMMVQSVALFRCKLG